jgi:cytochrome c oxidase subunit 2
MDDKRLPYAKFGLATLVLTLITSLIMVPIRWNGEAASEERADIDRLLDVMIVLSSFVFWLVMVLLAYSLYKFKAKPGDESDGEPIHGNTRLEIAWTLIPTVIVLFGAGLSWWTLDKIEAREPDHMTVDVYSQQFAWSFTYPEEQKFSRGELHVPVDKQVVFRLHALDVIHSFWVPEWGIKKDNVPGITTQAIVTPNKEGTYQLICTELCGFGHTTMRAVVVVESEQDYEEWVAKQEEPPNEFIGDPHEQSEGAQEPAGA